MKDLMEMLAKKKKKKMSENDMSSKMEVLENLKELASQLMGGDLGELKKVTVAADNKQDLEKGLDKAKMMLGEMPEMEDENEEDEDC